MSRFRFAASALALLLFAAPALAEDVKAGGLTISGAWARATPKGAPVGAGYLEIRNDGDAPDRLTGGSADFAGVEVHEMKMADGVMRMRPLPDGLTIPAHGTVALQPGGNHLMFAGLRRPLVKGEVAAVTLSFERAGPVAVAFRVGGIGASGPDSP